MTNGKRTEFNTQEKRTERKPEKNEKSTMKRLLCILLFVSLSLSSCGNHAGEEAKYRAYLYKQPERDGLLCVFYSNYPGIAEQNAQMFADMHQEKYGVPLIVRTEAY
ncbi:MAG: hypothetical protein WCK32_07020 [Chlorobiaceae bacterium]